MREWYISLLWKNGSLKIPRQNISYGFTICTAGNDAKRGQKQWP
jgi:hypothetical protein